MGSLPKVQWLYNVTLLGFLSGLAVTYRLWMAESEIPAFSLFPAIPGVVSTILSTVLVVSLIVQLFFKRWLLFPILSIVTTVFLCLLDVNRFQPWVYFYVVLLLIFSLFPFQYYRFKSWEPIIQSVKWVLILLLIWSGFNKLNMHYFEEVAEYTVSGLAPIFGISASSLKYLAWPVPVIQIVGVLFLFIGQLKRIGLVALVVTQLFAVVLINGVNGWNMAIAPWNLTVIALLIIGFSSAHRGVTLYTFKRLPFLKVLLFSVGTLPFFQSIISISPLNFSLYSGKALYGFVYIEKNNLQKIDLPEEAVIDVGTFYMVDLVRWSDQVYHLPLYPSERNFELLEKYFAANYPKQKVFLQISRME